MEYLFKIYFLEYKINTKKRFRILKKKNSLKNYKSANNKF